MNFNRVTPCKLCPFRTDVRTYLTRSRVLEIEHSMVGLQQNFPCHETTDMSGDEPQVTPETSHCAGGLILLERMNRPNQMMRIAERLGFYDRGKLNMQAPVFKTFKAMAKEQPSV